MASILPCLWFNCGSNAAESYPGLVNFGANQEIEYKP
jgi:hypothetical protein